MDEISTSIGVVVAGEITATVTSFMFPSRSKYKTNDGVGNRSAVETTR